MTNFWMKNLAIFHDAKKFETYFSCSTLIDIASCVDWSSQYRVGNTGTSTFYYESEIFYFKYRLQSGQSKTFISPYEVFHWNNWIWPYKIYHGYINWRWCLKRISWHWQQQYVLKKCDLQKQIFLPFLRENIFNKVVIRCCYIQIFPGFGKNFAKNLR